MKKFGFTLAEVLITMAIIGVIAAVTLPALNVNVTERSAITKYKKALSALNNIGVIIAANDGFNYSNLNTGAVSDDTRGNENGQLRREVWAVFDKYAKIDRRLTAAGEFPGGQCVEAENEGVIYFKDGTAICYGINQDGLIDIIVDVNGMKEPNMISTCADVSCTNRSIFDQFETTLVEEEALPGSMKRIGDGPVNNMDFASFWASEQ